MLPRCRHLDCSKAWGSWENARKSVLWIIRTIILHQHCYPGCRHGWVKKRGHLSNAKPVTNRLQQKQAQRSPPFNNQLDKAKE